jgi:hypothetical protein
MARQTRERGARSVTLFSIRSVLIVVDLSVACAVSMIISFHS